jgi:hypothetical protein
VTFGMAAALAAVWPVGIPAMTDNSDVNIPDKWYFHTGTRVVRS